MRGNNDSDEAVSPAALERQQSRRLSGGRWLLPMLGLFLPGAWMRCSGAVQMAKYRYAASVTDHQFTTRGGSSAGRASRKKQLVFHIGPPKTATTTVQTDPGGRTVGQRRVENGWLQQI